MTTPDLLGAVAVVFTLAGLLWWALRFNRGAHQRPEPAPPEPVKARRKYNRGRCPTCGLSDVPLRADGQPAKRWHPVCYPLTISISADTSAVMKDLADASAAIRAVPLPPNETMAVRLGDFEGAYTPDPTSPGAADAPRTPEAV